MDRSVAREVDEAGYSVHAYPVRRDLDGPWPAAGPRRNARMLGDADALIVFPGGRGTADCERQALALDLPVFRVVE